MLSILHFLRVIFAKRSEQNFHNFRLHVIILPLCVKNAFLAKFASETVIHVF